jgi:hypothetical protein
MTEIGAFAIIVLGLAPGAGWLLGRSRRALFAAGTSLSLALLAVFVLESRRPDLVAPLIRGSQLALLYPAWGLIPSVTVLTALARRTNRRNRRGVLLFCGALTAFGFWQASALLADPAAQLSGGHWKGRCCIQSANWSCAPAASVSLLKTVGIEATEGEMARLMRSRTDYGTFILNIERGLERKLAPSRKDLHAELRRLDYEELLATHASGIANMRLELLMDHAVAFVACDAAGVTLLDPAAGERRLTRAEFQRQWRGYAVLVVPQMPRAEGLHTSEKVEVP